MNPLPEFALILPSAGTGTRLGTAIPKPFLEVAGRTLLEVAVARFQATGRLAQIVVPTHPLYMDRARQILKEAFPDLDSVVLEGGSERQHSITNGLDAVRPGVGYVAVHDAVRPFVTPGEIIRCLEAAALYGAAILGVPAKDTIKRVSPMQAETSPSGFPIPPHQVAHQSMHRITETPDRSTLWQAQTPQIFRADLLRDAYRNAISVGFLGTDDASLVETLGQPVYIVEGGRENFKITYPVDLRLAELLLQHESMDRSNEGDPSNEGLHSKES